MDEIKDDLPRKEEKVVGWLKSFYATVTSFSSNVYTSTSETIKKNPVVSSQLLLALIGSAGAFLALSVDPRAYDKLIQKQNARYIISTAAVSLAVLDSFVISYASKKKA